MTTDASPLDYDELGNMDSWTNNVRERERPSGGTISQFPMKVNPPLLRRIYSARAPRGMKLEAVS